MSQYPIDDMARLGAQAMREEERFRNDAACRGLDTRDMLVCIDARGNVTHKTYDEAARETRP